MRHGKNHRKVEEGRGRDGEQGRHREEEILEEQERSAETEGGRHGYGGEMAMAVARKQEDGDTALRMYGYYKRLGMVGRWGWAVDSSGR